MLFRLDFNELISRSSCKTSFANLFFSFQGPIKSLFY